MKTKAWNLAVATICIALALMPFLLVQLLGSERGTTWRVVGLDVVVIAGVIAGVYLIHQISKSPLARRFGIAGRVLFSALGFAFVLDTAQTFISAASHEALSQMALQCGKMFFGYFPGAAMYVTCLELWRWRKERKSLHSTPD